MSVFDDAYAGVSLVLVLLMLLSPRNHILFGLIEPSWRPHWHDLAFNNLFAFHELRITIHSILNTKSSIIMIIALDFLMIFDLEVTQDTILIHGLLSLMINFVGFLWWVQWDLWGHWLYYRLGRNLLCTEKC